MLSPSADKVMAFASRPLRLDAFRDIAKDHDMSARKVVGRKCAVSEDL